MDGEPAKRSREKLGGGSEEGRRRRGVFGGDLRRQQCPSLHRKTQPGQQRFKYLFYDFFLIKTMILFTL